MLACQSDWVPVPKRIRKPAIPLSEIRSTPSEALSVAAALTAIANAPQQPYGTASNTNDALAARRHDALAHVLPAAGIAMALTLTHSVDGLKRIVDGLAKADEAVADALKAGDVVIDAVRSIRSK